MANAAIWGAGNIANTHAEALLGNHVNIKAIVDIDAKKAESFAARWNIPRHGTGTDLLFADDIDCVHICTPPNLHYEMVIKLLNSGKHVLCEKPLCFENEQAREIMALAREKGLACAINFNVRFHMACRRAKELVQSEEFGRVLLIHGNYLQEFSALPAPLDWRYNPKLAGRMHAVTEIGSHWMDIAQYISGKRIVAVSAQFDSFYPIRYVENGRMYAQSAPGREPIEVKSEEAAVVSLRFEDGAIGVVTLSEISQGRYNHLSLEITGEKQSLWWNAEENNVLNFAQSGGTVQKNVFAFGNGFADTFRTLVAEFYKDVEAGGACEAPIYPIFDDGMRNVILCNAILESAGNDSKWVKIEV